MKAGNIRSIIVGEADSFEGGAHIGRIDIALDDIQDGHVTVRVLQVGRYQSVLGLQQPTHHIQHGGLSTLR